MPFVRVAGYFEAMDLNAPRVIEADIENGFLLLTDLGTSQYLDVLEREPAKADALYFDAMDALQKMQQLGEAYQNHLPAYDETLLRFELSLFHDWLCGTHLALDLSEADEQRWQSLCDVLVENAMSQPQVFVHRDYHSRNLMFMESANPGILDFQDAVEGPLTYDLVSLLKDCYIAWPADQVRQWARYFYDHLPDARRQQMVANQFGSHFELMGVQRQLKAAGIFCRLCHRDSKPQYLDAVPRTLAYITELRSRYAELDFIIDLIEARILPAWKPAA